MNALTIHAPVPAMTVSDVERVAMAIAQGGLFGSRDPNAVLTLCLLAQAEGQHPAVVFRDYHIISGKPAKKADAMLRDFITSGGKVKWHQLDDDKADATFSHPSGEARIEWTVERARQAGIANPMWKKYPRQMLRSRVISEGVRTVYPGATSGLYEVEEVQSMSDTNPAPPIDITPANDQPPITTGENDQRVPTQEPAPREKLDGPHTSKTALRKAINEIIGAVRKAETVEAIDALKAEHKHTINQARRDWPALVDGDPNVPEDIGLKGAFENKRAELSAPAESLGYQMLISALEECATKDDLNSLMDQHEAVVEALDDVESRKWGRAWDAREAAIEAVAPLGAG